LAVAAATALSLGQSAAMSPPGHYSVDMSMSSHHVGHHPKTPSSAGRGHVPMELVSPDGVSGAPSFGFVGTDAAHVGHGSDDIMPFAKNGWPPDSESGGDIGMFNVYAADIRATLKRENGFEHAVNGVGAGVGAGGGPLDPAMFDKHSNGSVLGMGMSIDTSHSITGTSGGTDVFAEMTHVGDDQPERAA